MKAYENETLSFKERAKALVAEMTLEEKVFQTLHWSAAIDRLGIKAYNWWNEALHGVARAGVATVFPQAIGLAAAFDEDMMEEVGDHVSTEGRAKFNMQQKYGDTDIYKGLTFWAPNVNIFRDPLTVNIAEYVAKAHICNDYFTNFADAPARISAVDHWQLDFAKLCGSELMISYEKHHLGGKEPIYSGAGRNCPYRLMRAYSYSTLPTADYTPQKKVWLDGIGVAITRECEMADKGLYLAFKGGHNAESHNHNDVGSFIVFADGNPVFIDLGVGEYTRKTFSGERYQIPSMRSEYHNLPTFNGILQKNGRSFEARNYNYDAQSGALELDATAAYPQDAGLESYTRRAENKDGKISITDKFTLKDNGCAVFNLICESYPQKLSDGIFTIRGREVSYDPSLKFGVEEIPCDSTETRSLPKAWRTDKLWRVTLFAELIEGGKAQEFTVTVK